MPRPKKAPRSSLGSNRDYGDSESTKKSVNNEKSSIVGTLWHLLKA